VFVGCRKKPAIVVLDMKTGKEVAAVTIPGDIDDLFYDAKRRRLYASCGEGFVAVVRAGQVDGYKLAERRATAKEACTSFFDPSSGRLYVAVPRQPGNEGLEVQVYQARR
jgi:hypothetical protein